MSYEAVLTDTKRLQLQVYTSRVLHNDITMKEPYSPIQNCQATSNGLSPRQLAL